MVIRHRVMQYLEYASGLSFNILLHKSAPSLCFESNKIVNHSPSIALSPFHRCLCGHIMLGLPPTPTDAPFVLESLQPNGWILLCHYHLYTSTGTFLNFNWHHKNTCLVLQLNKSTKKKRAMKKEERETSRNEV